MCRNRPARTEQCTTSPSGWVEKRIRRVLPGAGDLVVDLALLVRDLVYLNDGDTLLEPADMTKREPFTHTEPEGGAVDQNARRCVPLDNVLVHGTITPQHRRDDRVDRHREPGQEPCERGADARYQRGHEREADQPARKLRSSAGPRRVSCLVTRRVDALRRLLPYAVVATCPPAHTPI
jgi:hypothetical protein